MTTRELELKLREKGVPTKLYSLDGGNHIQKECVLEKKLWWYEVYIVEFGYKYFVKKFKTESEACEYFYKKIITHCRYADIPLNGIEPIVHKEPKVWPKFHHEEMKHIAELFDIKMNYTRDIHSLTFDNGYTFESEHFFQDYYYKDMAIVCLTDSNETKQLTNNINVSNNVFMINDRGETVWRFNRSFVFPDRNTPVGTMGLNYESEELYMTVYDDKNYRPQYVLDPSTGILLKREEKLCPPRSIFRSITFRRKSRLYR